MRINPVWRVIAAGFVLDGCVMVAFMATPFFVLNQLGGDVAWSGLVVGIQMLAYAISCLVSSGFASHSRHPLRWAMVGVVFFVLFHATMPVTRNLFICCIQAALAFASLALVWPALQAWIGGEREPIQRARFLARFNMATGLGFATSPLLAGPLYDHSYLLPFIVLGLLGAIVLILVVSLPDEKHYFKEPKVTSTQAASTLVAEPRDDSFLWPAWCAVLGANMLLGASRAVYPERIDTLIEAGSLRFLSESEPAFWLNTAPATKYSWLATGASIATLVLFYLMGRTTGWRHRFSLLVYSQILAAGAFLFMGYTDQLMTMFLCFMIVGANYGFCFFIAMYHSLEHPTYKHQRAAINEGLLGLGAFIGAVGFGYGTRFIGIQSAFSMAPVILLLLVITQTVFYYSRIHSTD